MVLYVGLRYLSNHSSRSRKSKFLIDNGMSDIKKPEDKDDKQPRDLASLRKSEERLALAIEGSGVGLWDWHIRTGEVGFNDRWAQIAGYTLEELAPLNIDTRTKLTHAHDLEKSDQLLRKCFDSKLPIYECEMRIRHRDGHWVWVLDHGKVVERDMDGTPVRMSGTRLDITKRKQAEKAMRESEQALRTIFDNTHDAIFVHSVDGQILDVNRKMLELYRVTKEQALRSSIAEDFSTPENPIDQLEFRWDRVLKGESLLFEWKAKRPNDGSVFDVEVALKRITLCDRAVVLANVRDISIRKAAEAILRESEEKFRALVEHSNDAIMRFDRQRRHLYVNPIVQKLCGIPAAKFIGKTHEELGFPDSLCSLWRETIDQVFRSGDVQRIEFQLPNDLWIDWMLMPELDESGQVKGVITSARDITERKKSEEEKARLEDQLRRSQKMEAVGRLAGGVAHDFNNMLGVIIGNTEMAMEETNPTRPIFAALKEIRAAAERSADLTKQLLVFARRQTVAPEVLDLNHTVEGMLKMLQRLIGEHIALVWLPGKGVWEVRVDPSQIDQILANLCVNARDAIADVGSMTIETGNVALNEAYCEDHVDAIPGDFVLLAVSDDGCGMDKKTIENLFEPFFTTKEAGVGSGLGLATVYGIVKQNKGFINVYSKPGKGTTFRIYLPRHKGKAEQKQKKRPAEPAARGHETILLAEDEPAILKMTTKMLQQQGYTVLAAATPAEAIRLADMHSGEIHLLMTDVVMPEMNGRQLHRNLLTGYPNLKCLFMSGYTANVIAHNGVLDDGVDFIQKPFMKQDLVVGVRETLDKK
jgi:PAS domain S-box-containing protein